MKKTILTIVMLGTLSMACPNSEKCKATNFEEKKTKCTEIFGEVFKCIKDAKNEKELKSCKKDMKKKMKRRQDAI